MLKSLLDFFLLISTDRKSITSNNISTFHTFIIKKIPEIENQRPGILITSLIKYNNKFNKEKIPCKQIKGFIFQNEEINNKIDKNTLIKNFQNELLFLFNDLIDYLYEEKIFVISDDNKDILKNRINKKSVEKNLLYSKNKSLSNRQMIQEIRKKEIRNYIIELINNNKMNNNFISFNFTIKNFINFFNSKNKDKNRYIIEKFIKIINPVIKQYQLDKKITHRKKINKVKTKSLTKMPKINIDSNNIFKEKADRHKNIKFINSDGNNFISKINYSFNSKRKDKDKFHLNNIIIRKNKDITNYKKEKQYSNLKEENNITLDTIPCQTLNNCISFNNIQKNHLIENYLNNNLNLNKKDKISKRNLINKINNINNDKKNLKNENYYQKSRSSISFLNDNDFKEIKKKFCKISDEDLEEYNNKITGKRKTNITSISKNNNACFIY